MLSIRAHDLSRGRLRRKSVHSVGDREARGDWRSRKQELGEKKTLHLVTRYGIRWYLISGVYPSQKNSNAAAFQRGLQEITAETLPLFAPSVKLFNVTQFEHGICLFMQFKGALWDAVIHAPFVALVFTVVCLYVYSNYFPLCQTNRLTHHEEAKGSKKTTCFHFPPALRFVTTRERLGISEMRAKLCIAKWCAMITGTCLQTRNRSCDGTSRKHLVITSGWPHEHDA